MIAIDLMILVQYYILMKEKKGEQEMIDKISQHVRSGNSDSDRKELMTMIQKELVQN